jgi:LytS/YehU family sensor histidine kinase
MILEMSDKESVTLEEETEALRLYLELEKIRFGTDFNYSLTIEGNVDTEMLKIPPMIVQPYVENAIKHGLLHKTGNKVLAISFTRQDGALTITIDDNGIGRERASELQQQRKEKHQSFSTGANSKRIDLLNRDGRRNIGVVYVDKKNNGQATGTTVIITIPIG